MQLIPVTDLALLTTFHSVEDAIHEHDFVGLPADPLEERIPLLTQPETAGERTAMWLATDGETAVGVLTISTPTLDNLTVANVELSIHPHHRRQGHGRALSHAAVQQVRQLGRSRIFIELPEWPDPSRSGWRTLAPELGAKKVLENVRRTLDLEAHPPAPRCTVPPAYEVVQWVDQCPDALVDGAAYLMGRMTLDAPMGEMDFEQEKWDATRYREKEVSAVARQRIRIASAAVHLESGQVAGYTDIGVNRSRTDVAYQWDTIVDPDHRGHGLGMVLKTWNHALLTERIQGVRHLNTWNAASNSFMITVNDRMGFEPAETWHEHQVDL